MVDSLVKRGWTAEIIFYSDEEADSIYEKVVKTAGAYVPRVNPGNLPSEKGFFEFLNKLSANGVKGLSTPGTILGYGAKDALVKLTSTDLVPDDVAAYYDLEAIKKNVPLTLSKGERVLKQNRGSTGEGIWRVQLLDKVEGVPTLDARVKCTEAKDNHVEEWKLGEFLEFCEQYVIGEGGMLVDMPFLPRIKEGEIRVFMLHRTAVNIVHKKPADTADAFSATLFSGAKYKDESPEQWPELVKLVNDSLDGLIENLGGHDLPLIWTADFMLDDDENGGDKYILGEINASCVGFTTNLALSENVADTIIKMVAQ